MLSPGASTANTVTGLKEDRGAPHITTVASGEMLVVVGGDTQRCWLARRTDGWGRTHGRTDGGKKSRESGKRAGARYMAGGQGAGTRTRTR